MPQEMRQQRLTNGGSFYCPNGHSQHYTKPKCTRLQEEIEATKRELTAARCATLSEQNKRESVEREMKRRMRRVHAGVCPCCNRTFQNLARHMQTKHPKN